MPIVNTTHLRELQAFPGLPAPNISIVAGAEMLPGGGLRLGFVLHGAAEQLMRIVIPEPGSPCRTEGLWQHTCCEAFIAVPGETAYREFNFSPSGAWAAYAFSDYRQQPLQPLGPLPTVAFVAAAGTLTLATTLAAGWLPKQANNEKPERLNIGLSAVIETTDGELSYWALAHSVSKPDFHQPDSFVLPLEINHDFWT